MLFIDFKKLFVYLSFYFCQFKSNLNVQDPRSFYNSLQMLSSYSRILFSRICSNSDITCYSTLNCFSSFSYFFSIFLNFYLFQYLNCSILYFFSFDLLYFCHIFQNLYLSGFSFLGLHIYFALQF